MKSRFICFLVLSCLNFSEGSFRCDYKYSPKTRAWFKFFVVPATWFDARLRCILEGAVLASPTTPEIQDEMRDIMRSPNPDYEIFTGIHATFSPGDYYTVEGTPLSEIPVTWAKNEPDNKDNKESCITLNRNGELADHRCQETRPYICYKSEYFPIPVHQQCGTADLEYNFDIRTNKCYKFHTVPRNYSRAFMACSAEGGHLAIINSEVEATVLKELFEKHPESELVGDFRKDFAFIGVQNFGEHRDFRTIYGQTLTKAGYSVYATDEPRLNSRATFESCVAMYRSARLAEFWCDRPTTFFCEKNPSYLGTCRA